MSVLDGAFRIDNLSKGIKVSSHLFVAFLGQHVGMSSLVLLGAYNVWDRKECG